MSSIKPHLVVISRPDARDIRRLLGVGDKISLGRKATCAVKLEGDGISNQHCALHHDAAGRVMFVSYASRNPTLLNGERAGNEPVELHEGDRVRIGAYTIRVEPEPSFARTDPEENLLLEAIEKDPADDGARQVYEDWLDERGRLDDAEFLRLERALTRLDAGDEEALLRTRSRMRALARVLPAAWRHAIGRPAIESCKAAETLRFEMTCPRTWDRLRPTAETSVRHCRTCGEDVHFAASIVEARDLVARGRCVAVESAVPRRAHDLTEPEVDHVTIGRIVTPERG